jgi:hypothetical protein
MKMLLDEQMKMAPAEGNSRHWKIRNSQEKYGNYVERIKSADEGNGIGYRSPL